MFLITHRPPFGILDFADEMNYGCRYLLRAVLNVQPKYHLFGHVHAAYGIEKSAHTVFVNGALMSKKEIVNEGVLLDFR